MIQYIVILLDDTSTSFCHYMNEKADRRLIPLQTLKDGYMLRNEGESKYTVRIP